MKRLLWIITHIDWTKVKEHTGLTAMIESYAKARRWV